MKTIKAIMLCALLSLTSSAFAQDVFNMSFSDVNIEAGGTADLNVTFTSTVTIAGWQMFLYLPEGIEILEEDDEYAIELSDLHNKKHVCDVTVAADKSMMLVMSGGTKTYEMKANEGDLCTITLKASSEFSGSVDVPVKKIAIADKNGTSYEQSDVTFKLVSGTTGIKDVTADGMQADGKYLKNGKIIIKKGGKKYNTVGTIAK